MKNNLTDLGFLSIFSAVWEKNGLPVLPLEKIEKFRLFADRLLETNKITNLTAIRELPDVITKHFADSASAVALIPQNARVLDLGCGPGFPSIPLAILRDDLQITALDSTAKKIHFVKESANLLSISNLRAIVGRAEDPKLLKDLSGFDVVISRAVARLPVLCELCLPYVKLGGKMIAMKASQAEAEVAEAKNAIKTLGGAAPKLTPFDLISYDGVCEPRCLIEIEKIKNTPAGYPRAYAIILKKTL